MYSAKTTKSEKSFPLFLVVEDAKVVAESKQTLIISQLVNKARKYQATPPNICNSEWLAQEFKQMFKDNKKVKIKKMMSDKMLNSEIVVIDLTTGQLKIFIDWNEGIICIFWNDIPKVR